MSQEQSEFSAWLNGSTKATWSAGNRRKGSGTVPGTLQKHRSLEVPKPQQSNRGLTLTRGRSFEETQTRWHGGEAALLDKVILQVSPEPTISKKQEGAEIVTNSGQADASGSSDTPAVRSRGLGRPTHQGALKSGSERKETGVLLQRLDVTSLGGHLGGSPEKISKGPDRIPEKKQPGDHATVKKAAVLDIRKGSGRAVDSDRADVINAEKDRVRSRRTVRPTRSAGSRSTEAISNGNTLQSSLALSGPEVETPVECEESATATLSAVPLEEPRGALEASVHPNLKQDTNKVELVETAKGIVKESLSGEEDLAVHGELENAMRVWNEEETATEFQSSPGLAESGLDDQGPRGGLSQPFVFVKVEGTKFKVNPITLCELSGYFRQELQDYALGLLAGLTVNLQGFPGGASTFVQILDFALRGTLSCSVENVVALRCAADYLEMTQKDTTGASQDLVSATEAYIHDTAFESLDSATALLKTCHVHLLAAERLCIVESTIQAVGSHLFLKGRYQSLTSKTSPPRDTVLRASERLKGMIRNAQAQGSVSRIRLEDARADAESHLSTLGQVLEGLSKEEEEDCEGWLRKLCGLDLDMLRRLIVTLEKGEVDYKLIGRIIFAYAEAELSTLLEQGDSNHEPSQKQARIPSSVNQLQNAAAPRISDLLSSDESDYFTAADYYSPKAQRRFLSNSDGTFGHERASSITEPKKKMARFQNIAALSQEELVQKRKVLETLVYLLPWQLDALPTAGTLFFLRLSRVLGHNGGELQEELEARMASQLPSASVEDLLLLRRRGCQAEVNGSQETEISQGRSAENWGSEDQYDIGLVLALAQRFLAASILNSSDSTGNRTQDELFDPLNGDWKQAAEKLSRDFASGLTHSRNCSVIAMKELKAVGALLDEYLRRVASDPLLDTDNFEALASCLPPEARVTGDALNSAMLTYRKNHPGINDAKLLRILWCTLPHQSFDGQIYPHPESTRELQALRSADLTALTEDDSDHNSSRFDANLEAEEAAEELDKEHLRLTIEMAVVKMRHAELDILCRKSTSDGDRQRRRGGIANNLSRMLRSRTRGRSRPGSVAGPGSDQWRRIFTFRPISEHIR